MQARFATAFKNKNQFCLEGAETQELTDAVNAVRLLIIKKELTELLDKETVGCMRATD